nr:zinc finger, CCHC-type [Tanacetum cinerariifolium]
MASNFAKLEKFEGVDFRRWQKKMHFLLSSMSVVYVLTAPVPEDGNENPTMDQSSVIEESFRAQDNDKPKGNNVTSPSVVNMVEHNNSSRYNDKGKRKHHDTRANPKKKPKVTCWKCRKHRHLKKDCKSGNIGNIANGSSTKGSKDGSFNPLKGNESTALVHGHGCVDLRFSSGKVSSLLNVLHVLNIRKNLVSSSVLNNVVTNKLNIVSDNIGSAFMSTSKLNDLILWHARLGHVHFNRMQDMSKDGLIPAFDMDSEKCSLRLHDPKLRTLGKRGIECTFVGYAEHSMASKLNVVKPNDLVEINSIIESKDAIFDEHRFSSVPRPSQRSLVKGTKDSGSLVVLKKDDPKTFDEAMKSQDVAFLKEAINDEMDSIMGNNIWVLTDLPLGYRSLGCKWIFKRKLKDMGEEDVILGIRIKHERNGIAISQSHYVEKNLKKFNYFDCTLFSTLMDTCEKLMSNKGQVVSQLKYSRVIGCLMYAMTCTRLDIAFVVGKLSRYTSNPGYTDASLINNTKDNSSTSGEVFFLGGGAISWAFKKQTCITSSTMEYEFMALAAIGKEAEWLKNLLLEITLWVEPISPISIRYVVLLHWKRLIARCTMKSLDI